MATAPAIETPAELITALERELEEVPAPLGKQIAALSELFRLFTSDRSRIRSEPYLDAPRFRSAYLRYHLPLNVARATWALQETLRLHPRLAGLTDVVDLGAGPGSASIATLFSLPREPARGYWLQDRSRSALKVARRLIDQLGKTGVREARTMVSALPALPEIPPRALVWLGMVLNELDSRSRRGPDSASFLDALASRLETTSVVMITEPALREPGRKLLQLHDAALATGQWRVIAPCTHQLACPLLRERDRSWCHFRFRWNAPSLVRAAADPLRLAHGEPSIAYLALERVERRPSVDPGDAARARVIGDAMPVKGGKTGVYVCHQGQRDVLLAGAASLRRGDIARLDPAPQPPRQAGVTHSSSLPSKSGSQASGGSRGRPPLKR